MGNIISTLTSNKFIKWLLSSSDIKKKFCLFIIIGFLYQIYKCRARLHPNIPGEGRIKFHWFLGHSWWFAENIMKDNYSELYHKEIELPFFKANPGFKMLCGSAPGIPGAPLPRWNVQIYDPELVKKLFYDEFETIKKTDRVMGPFYELWGEGIFSSDPPKWKWHRKIASRIFSMRNVKNHIFGCGVKNAQILINKLYQFTDKQTSVDIHDILGRFTLQAFVESAFGEHCEIIEIYPKEHPFNNSFDETLHLFAARYGDFFWKIKRKLKIGKRERVEIPKCMKIINDFVNGVIDQRQNKKLFHDESGEDKYDLLSLFMKHRKDIDLESANDGEFSTKEIRDITVNFITAARDTTKTLLSWFLYEIHRKENKHVLERLLKEIDANYDATKGDINNIEYDETFKHKYKYLTAALLETLRFHPSVPFLQRYAVKDVDLMYKGNKYTIAKDTGICVHTYGYARGKHIFGQDADKFNPERFYEKGINTYNEYEFPMFNMNPRLCLGRNVAIVQAKIVAILLLRNFKIIPVKNQKVVQLFSIIYTMRYGFKINLKKRNYDK